MHTPHQLAEDAAMRWTIPATALEHVSTGGNIIYRTLLDNETVYLRLTEPRFRSLRENQAECDFLDHLEREGVPIAAPLPSMRERVVEPLETDDGIWSASVFTAAPGRWVRRGDDLWTEHFVREWGAALGRVHRAAATFEPVTGWERRRWDEDFWLRHATLYLPPDDTRSRREFDLVMAHFRDLSPAPAQYGMTHGDFAPANFRYEPDEGITAFDFGNCAEHWYMWDVAVALSTVLWETDEEKDAFRVSFFYGYTKEFSQQALMVEQLNWFLRLRMLVVFLSRLWSFGPNPTAEQQRTIDRIRANVHHPVGWDSVGAAPWREMH